MALIFFRLAKDPIVSQPPSSIEKCATVNDLCRQTSHPVCRHVVAANSAAAL